MKNEEEVDFDSWMLIYKGLIKEKKFDIWNITLDEEDELLLSRGKLFGSGLDIAPTALIENICIEITEVGEGGKIIETSFYGSESAEVKKEGSQISLIIERMLTLKLPQLKIIWKQTGQPNLHYKQEYQSALRSVIEGTNDEISEEKRKKIIDDISSIDLYPITNEREPLKFPKVMPNNISKPYELKVSDTNKTIQCLPTASNIVQLQIKNLPFYDKLAVLLKPIHLNPNQTTSTQKALIDLSLKIEHIQIIQKYRRNDSNGTVYDAQVILRFCLFDTSTTQNDNFPLNLDLFVNGCPCELPNYLPCRPGDTPRRPPQPINITKYLKINPESSNQLINKIIVHWSQEPSKKYMLSAFLVHKRTSAELFDRIKLRDVKPPNYTSTLIKEKLKDDADNEIATTMLRASLICPLAKTRMKTPFRSLSCKHVQCFDGLSYLQMNERHPKWTCPVCNKEITYESLVIDGYFLSVIKSINDNETTEIQLHSNGSWSKFEMEKNNIVKKKAASKNIDVIDVCDSDEEDAQNNNQPCSSNSERKLLQPCRDGDYIDLTLDDD
ncbi:hypothetical protein PVAND_003882 [Polypedilum vanderplanki]|uniref:Uncharacterized protein n=1 Tax=Polypedilum vanderplanki TaxID=319348 RepID=A0A9J6BVY7_POLVA|nr:hypothetical protein PVAND_003882 [Polypedilum vanderplanki]